MSKYNKVISLGGPLPEVDEEEDQINSGSQKGVSNLPVGGQVSSSTLNATPMKPKPKPAVKSQMSATGTGGNGDDSEDDPMGRIPRPGQPPQSKTREVSIRGGQFVTEKKDMGTSYEAPTESSTSQQAEVPKKPIKGPSDAATTRMLRTLENEMTRGRRGGIEDMGLDQAMFEIAQISSSMVKGRKEMMSQAAQQQADPSPATEEAKAHTDTRDKPKTEKTTTATKTGETGKQRRQRLHDAKRAAKKKKDLGSQQTYVYEIGADGAPINTADAGKAKTQEQIDAAKCNIQFENYYKGLGILKEEEWDVFYSTLKTSLDICFRVNSIDKHKQRTLSILQAKIEKIRADPAISSKAPEAVKWYPNQMAYCFNDLGRVEMRKNAAFKDFHQFLVLETENGRIFRQEKVSMIPVTILNIEPQHTCLDMCAAPGSKTIQILEYLHQDGMMNSGYVVANDTDVKRAYMLTHQARRLNSPSLFITQNDARFLPNLKIDDK